MRRKGKRRGHAALRYPMTRNDAANQKHDAKNAGPGDRNCPSMALEHPPSHDDGDGNGHADGEHSPGAIGECVDHDNSEAGQRDQKNKEHSNHRHQTGEGTDLGAGHVRERAPAMAHRSDEHGEVLHTAGQHRADQNPEKARGKTKLRGQRRPDQRPGARDGGEVMSKQYPARRRNVVMSIREKMTWSGAAIVQRQRLCGNKCTVITIGKGVHAQRPQQQRKSIHASLLFHNVVAEPAAPIERILHPSWNPAQINDAWQCLCTTESRRQ
jgi:hypothetical protein